MVAALIAAKLAMSAWALLCAKTHKTVALVHFKKLLFLRDLGDFKIGIG